MVGRRSRPSPPHARISRSPHFEFTSRKQGPPKDLSVRTFGALSNSTFRCILAFGAFYYTYRAAELAVLSWFVLTLTGSEFLVALVGASRIAPCSCSDSRRAGWRTAVSPPYGHWAVLQPHSSSLHPGPVD
jgi:hypothetical protein